MVSWQYPWQRKEQAEKWPTVEKKEPFDKKDLFAPSFAPKRGRLPSLVKKLDANPQYRSYSERTETTTGATPKGQEQRQAGTHPVIIKRTPKQASHIIHATLRP